jgi:NADH-quinone oxidoreductase subunit A
VGQYLPIFALLVLAVLFCVLSFMASRLLAPRRVTLAKLAPYESGIIPGREPPRRFSVRFYLIAMIFIVFDIEIVFLYPWTMAHRALGVFGLVAISVFAASVFESFMYLLAKGTFEWGPLRRPVRAAAMVSPERTASTTVRRVGTEGRYAQGEQSVLAALEPNAGLEPDAGPEHVGAPAGNASAPGHSGVH